MATLAITATPAPTLTNLRAEGIYGGIQLTWDIPSDDTYYSTQVWGSQTNDRSTALLLGEVTSSNWIYRTGLGETWYFWVRSVNIYGRADGAWEPVSDISTLSNIGGFVAFGSSFESAVAGTSWSTSIVTKAASADANFTTSTESAGLRPKSLNFYNAGLSALIPADATIVEVSIRVKSKVDSTSSLPTVKAWLSLDGAAEASKLSTKYGAYFAPTTSNLIQDFPNGISDTFQSTWGMNYDGATGLTREWTTDDIRNSNFGFHLEFNTEIPGGVTFSIDQVGVYVTYTTDGGVRGIARADSEHEFDVTTGDLIVSTGDAVLYGDFWMRSPSGAFKLFSSQAGSTGNVSMYSISGRVFFPAGTASLTVTHTYPTVNSASHIFATVAQNDTTAYIKNVDASANDGTFIIHLGANATAQTAVDYFIITV
jgi:hypothetical protein